MSRLKKKKLTVSSSCIRPAYIDVVHADSENGIIEEPIADCEKTDNDRGALECGATFSGDEEADTTDAEDATDVVMNACSCNCWIWTFAAASSSSYFFWSDLKIREIFHK